MASEQILHSKLNDKLQGVFESIISDRKEYYKDKPAPSEYDINNLISSYSNKNAAISLGAGLIPGPWGMIAAVPEIYLVLKNQISMVYDIGMAYGKEKVLTKELLIAIVLSSMGSAGIGLLTVHGGKYLVKRVSLKVFQKIVHMLAGKITQQLLKRMVAKWLPIAGAAAMAIWSKYTTKSIGNKAKEILSNPIEIEDEEILKMEVSHDLNELIILSLINLMKIDGKVDKREKEYIQSIIYNSALAQTIKEDLINKMESVESYTIDYSLFLNSPDELMVLITDLITLAKSDNEVHVKEKIYIKSIAKKLNISDSDIEDMLK